MRDSVSYSYRALLVPPGPVSRRGDKVSSGACLQTDARMWYQCTPYSNNLALRVLLDCNKRFLRTCLRRSSQSEVVTSDDAILP